jgi:hypothetical protein
MKKIDKNITELPCKNGCIVLFSHDKPVAAYVPKHGYFRTETRWHLTTSKHIRKWLQGKKTHAKRVNDSFFHSLLEA